MSPVSSDKAGWKIFGMGVITGACLLVSAGALWVMPDEDPDLDVLIAPQLEDPASNARVASAVSQFAEALALIEANHVSQTLEPETRIRMLNAALQELDPYSGYLDTRHTNALITNGEDATTPRLGVLIMDVDGRYTIEAVAPGSPAEIVGIIPGDQVIRVGQRFLGEASPQVVNQAIADEIAAHPGARITLGILRPGRDEEISITVTPETVPSFGVHHLGRIDGVVHLHIERFYDGLSVDLMALLQREMARGPLKGVVLDLRGNGGGLTSEMIRVASFFLPDGKLLYRMSGRGIGDEDVHSSGTPIFSDLGLSVIIDGMSASSAEIFAGAIQAHERGPILGWPSYGKGTIQRVYPTADGAVKITVAEYLDGKLRPIQGLGIVPDVRMEQEDPGYRPSRFSADFLRDRAIDLARGQSDVAQR